MNKNFYFVIEYFWIFVNVGIKFFLILIYNVYNCLFIDIVNYFF